MLWRIYPYREVQSSFHHERHCSGKRRSKSSKKWHYYSQQKESLSATFQALARFLHVYACILTSPN